MRKTQEKESVGILPSGTVGSGGKDRLTQGGAAPGLGEAWRKESKTCGDIKQHCAIWNSRDGLNTQWKAHRIRDELHTTKKKTCGDGCSSGR